jgi:hypothetical protein
MDSIITIIIIIIIIEWLLFMFNDRNVQD